MSAIATIEDVLIGGNLESLSPPERMSYYNRVCESLSLNPLTKPFEYLKLNGKLILYARRDAAEQLRKRDKVSVDIQSAVVQDGCYVVTAKATTPDGRFDTSVGAVWIDTLQGEVRANAMMKAETKAKRRVTLSICGLGMLDETEVDSVAPVLPHRKPQLAAGTAPTNAGILGIPDEPEDADTVNAYLNLLNECRNRAEAEDVWGKAKIDPKLTETGREHVKKIYGTVWKALPKAKEVVNEEAE